MHLSFGKRRIDQPSAVMDIQDICHLCPASRNINFHLHKCTSEGICIILDLIAALRCEMPVVSQAVKLLRRQLAKGHENLSVRCADNISVYNIQIFFHLTSQIMRCLDDFLFQKLPGLTDRESRHVSLSGGVCAGSERSHIRILSGNDMHHLERDPHRLRRHLREGRIRALSDLGLSYLHLDTAVLIEHHTARGCLKGDGPYTCVVPEDGHSDTASDISCLMRVFRKPPVVVELFSSLLHTFPECIIIVYIFRKPVFEPLRHDIFHAELIRRYSDGTGHIIGMALHGEHGLRNAIASHGSGSRLVCKYCICISLYIRARIELRETPHTFRRNTVSVGRISALIRETLKFTGRICAIRPHIRDNVEMDRMPYSCRCECLLPGNIHFDRSSAYHRSQISTERFIEDILFIPESAADVWLDDTDFPPRYSKCLTDYTPADVRNLGGGNDGDPPLLHIGIADRILYVTVLYSRSLIPSLYLGEPGFFYGVLIISVPDRRVFQDIIGIFLMYLRGAVLHRLMYIKDKRQFLILHFQRPQRLRCRHFIFRYHGSHVITVISDVPL